MDPMALVQYQMLRERVIAQWLQTNNTLPLLEEEYREIAKLAPYGLGKPLPLPSPELVDWESLRDAYTTLWWNYLFLREGLSRIERRWDKAILAVRSRVQALQRELSAERRRVQALADRDPSVVYTRYDSFDTMEYVHSSTDAVVDTSSGVVRLGYSNSLVSSRYRTLQTENGVRLVFDQPAEVSGLRVHVDGSGVLSIQVQTETGTEDVFRSAFGGEGDVEFGARKAMEIMLSISKGVIRSVVPFNRRYNDSSYLVSTVWSIPAGIRGQLSSALKLSVEADMPQGTSVRGFVRFTSGSSSGNWLDASRPVPLPVLTEQVELSPEQWQLQPEGVYRHPYLFDVDNLRVEVGIDQWSIQYSPMDSDEVTRVASRKPISVNPGRFSSAPGFLRSVECSPMYESDGTLSSVRPVSPVDQNDILYLLIGSEARFALSAHRLQPGTLYMISAYVHSQGDSERVVFMELHGTNDRVCAGMFVNSQQVLSHRIGSGEAADRKQRATVKLRDGWNLVQLIFATASEDTLWLVFGFGARNVRAFNTPFTECSPHLLRYDPRYLNGYYALYPVSGGVNVEMAMPMRSIAVGGIVTRPPRVTVTTSRLDNVDGVQVMLQLATGDGSVSPVVKAYRLEVLE
ncbi:MAG: hypothetical protein KatS3mg023_3735 [Armatimonadota bacterium]|nr:MAG: hypothetical protein KatS3mg023_3735 [Armatimonadota bacterium]